MNPRLLFSGIVLLFALFIAGCSGGNERVNADKDKPVHPKKDKDK